MHKISNIYFVIKLYMFRASSVPTIRSFFVISLHVSGIFCAHHQELSTVRTAVGTFHAGYVTASKQSQLGTEFQPDSAWKRSHSLHETYQLPSVQ